MTTKSKVNIGMSWKAFGLILKGLIRTYTKDAKANEYTESIDKLCFSADILLELQKKKIDTNLFRTKIGC